MDNCDFRALLCGPCHYNRALCSIASQPPFTGLPAASALDYTKPARKEYSDKCCIFRQTDEVLNTGKQIDYWIISAKSDLDTAELLIRESKFIHGLFFCHLAIEKGLKAHVVKVTANIPPKSHNLIYLLGLSNIEFEESFEDFLGILMKYQLEGRYPDYNPVIPTKDKVVDYLNKTKKMLIWIEKKL